MIKTSSFYLNQIYESSSKLFWSTLRNTGFSKFPQTPTHSFQHVGCYLRHFREDLISVKKVGATVIWTCLMLSMTTNSNKENPEFNLWFDLFEAFPAESDEKRTHASNGKR